MTGKIQFKIKNVNKQGAGMGFFKGMPVFVPGAVPGDLVEAELKRVKRHYQAEQVEVIKRSSIRTKPVCKHFGVCGGCAWQHIKYEEQLNLKKKAVERLFSLNQIPVNLEGVIASPQTEFYRNRMDYIFWPDGLIGLRQKRKWDKIVDIKKCCLLSEESNEIIESVRELIKSNNIPIYDTRTKKGFLKYLVIREGKNTGQRMIIFVTSKGNLLNSSDILRSIGNGMTSIYQSVNDSVKDISVGKPRLIRGDEVIIEMLLDKKFRISPNSFFQTNTEQAEQMMKYVLDLGKRIRPQTMLDLYCGVGVFSVLLSDIVENVVGVEVIEDAIIEARKNATLNRVENAKFVWEDVNEFARKTVGKKEIYDLILLDPPREGIHPKTRKEIVGLRPRDIIYVSCNPHALVSDLLFLRHRYDIKEIKMFDMFPHTPHVETVVWLRKRVG